MRWPWYFAEDVENARAGEDEGEAKAEGRTEFVIELDKGRLCCARRLDFMYWPVRDERLGRRVREQVERAFIANREV